MGGVEGALQLGLLYAIPAVAVAFAFRIIGFPDLTPDGSFTFGAAVGGVLMVKGGSQELALGAAIMCGSMAGALTAMLHGRLGISKLLSGILVMTMLYSLSLRVMAGSNLSLLSIETFLSTLPYHKDVWGVAGAAAPLVVVLFTLMLLMQTNVGVLLRATGDNDEALLNKGIPLAPQHIAGLVIVNGMAGGSGFIISQYQGFVDVSMGSGLVIMCLAALVIGESIVRPSKTLLLLVSPVVGMVAYQMILTVALSMGLHPADLKLATAILALVFVASERIALREKSSSRKVGNHNV